MQESALLAKACTQNHIQLTPKQQAALQSFLELLERWNQHFNLTAITNYADSVYLHVIDSLLLMPHIKGDYCLDVGTGAGFPGIPLAIAYPEKEWVLLDKNGKKTRFLNQVLLELNLKNVKVVKARAENYQSEKCFTTIVSRALGCLTLFVSITKHLLCQHGILIAQKGKLPEEELAAMPADWVSNIIPLTLQGKDVQRHIIILAAGE